MVHLPCADDLVFLNNGFVLATWATVTNVAYLIAGVWGMYTTHQRTLHRLHPTAQVAAVSSPLIPPQQILLLYAWLIVIGLASTIYHSSLQPWSLCMDYFAIEMFCLLLLWELQRIPRLLFWSVSTLVLGGTATLLTVSVADSSYHRTTSTLYTLTVTILMVVLYGIVWKDVRSLGIQHSPSSRWAAKYQQPYRVRNFTRCRWSFIGSSLAFALALVCYLLPLYVCPRERGGLFQMHSYWHVLSAVSLYFLVQTLSYLQR